jgi:integrase
VKRHVYDPKRPASPFFLRKSWEQLREATGFTDLRPHDLRHHCITRMLERGVNPETVRAIAGHVTAQMMDFYAHQRAQVKYEAVMAIEQGREVLQLEAENRPAEPEKIRPADGQLFAPRTRRA